MFSKTDREKGNASANGAKGVKSVPSIISVNLHIIGNLSTDGDMQVDGRIEGDVTAQALTIGERALISGEIVADHVEIRGSVSGNIRARKIKIAKTAKVIGDIWHEVLSIEPGACIEGVLKRAKNGGEEREIPQPIKVNAASVPEQTTARAQSSASYRPTMQTSNHGDEKVAVKRAVGS